MLWRRHSSSTVATATASTQIAQHTERQRPPERRVLLLLLSLLLLPLLLLWRREGELHDEPPDQVEQVGSEGRRALRWHWQRALHLPRAQHDLVHLRARQPARGQ